MEERPVSCLGGYSEERVREGQDRLGKDVYVSIHGVPPSKTCTGAPDLKVNRTSLTRDIYDEHGTLLRLKGSLSVDEETSDGGQKVDSKTEGPTDSVVETIDRGRLEGTDGSLLTQV